MNAKKVALFGTSGVVLAGALVYALGIYPPASSRDGQGAIGKRDVYRAEQPADANVNPDAAPVATDANAKDVKNAPELQDGQVVALQSGQMLALQNGQMLAVKNGQIVGLQNGQMFRLQNGQMFRLQNGQILRLQNGQLLALRNQMNSGNFAREMNSTQMNSGNFAKQ
jgi:hypothetical protein